MRRTQSACSLRETEGEKKKSFPVDLYYDTVIHRVVPGSHVHAHTHTHTQHGRLLPELTQAWVGSNEVAMIEHRKLAVNE